MKVETRREYDEDNMWESYSIKINGRNRFHIGVSGECPEDFTFSRSLSDVWDIPTLLLMAYNAGRDGETFDLEEIDVEGEE